MATATLTPRQQEIKKLMDSGKSPKEVAKKLRIGESAVYQALRRMRQRTGTATAKPKPAGRKTTASGSRSRSASKPRTRKSTARPARQRPATPAPARVPSTPLEAIEQRRVAITDELSSTQTALDEAHAAFEAATKAHDEATRAHAEELKQLQMAEAVLKGQLPKAANKSRQRSANGKSTAPVPPPAGDTEPGSPPAPAPAAPSATPSAEAPVNDAEPAIRDHDSGGVIDGQPTEDEAAAQDAAAEAPQAIEEERPGVPVDPAFEQTEAASAFGE